MLLIPLLAAGLLAPAFFAAGCALLTMILLRRSYRYFGNSRSRGGSGPAIDAQPRPTDKWDGAKKDANARFDRDQVELYDLARDLKGQLDSKIIVLNELVTKSQQQIDRLEALLEESKRHE